MKATLSLTHDCNLACKYCYAGRKHKSDMSLPTAQKAVDFALGLASAGSRVGFSFFGGEPLLCFELMVEIVQYIRSRQQDSARPLSLSITTDGALLTKPVLEFLVREHVDVCISIDGASHRTRSQPRLSGRARDVCRRCSQLKRSDRGVEFGTSERRLWPRHPGRSGRDRVSSSGLWRARHPSESIHLRELGANSRARLADAYTQVARCYIDRYQHGRELAVNLFDSKIILFLKGGYAPEDMCGMGETEWGLRRAGISTRVSVPMHKAVKVNRRI